ncbi:TPA: pyruvate ferredoxin oxidoreductase [Candidatus Poribacteria bacterium]|nr:pyruvate ferredoxin oxidoreductase [Candidatus Poribacteria bacterium]
MKEIRFHGRGGQGAVSASNILANSAFIEGKYVQSFLLIGAERRGAPIMAYTRIDDKPIRNRSQIYFPDYVIVLDSDLVAVVDVAYGIKQSGMLLINSDKPSSEFVCRSDIKVFSIDVTSIALKYKLGNPTAPIVNTSILGAFARISGEIKLDSLLETIMEFAPSKPKENALAAEEAYMKAGELIKT